MQDRHATHFGTRESGIALIGDLPWGSHFCQFYQTQEDLLEILVPYLRAGLRNNEFCVWVTDSPLGAEDASEALKKAVPCFEQYVQKGQMEILSCDQWRAGDRELRSAVVSQLDQAISRGFDGLRLACHALAEQTSGPSVRDTADTLCRYNVIAVFAYPRDQFDAIGLMGVVKNHRLALVKNAGRWEVIESSEAQSVKEALRRSEERLHSVFANMSEGYAYHRIVLDPRGNPCDFVFLEVNEAFERLTGLQSEDLIGRRATQALPGIEKDSADWIGTYGRVALSGKPVQFENYSQLLQRWYSVSAFSPHKGFFAVTFSDITERKATEEAMREANERLQNQAEELQAQAEELNAQAAELRAVNESLRQSRERLSRAQEIAHLGSWELDLTRNELTWSDEVYRIFGLRPQEFGATYEAFLARVHPDDRAAVDAAYSGSLRENRDRYEIEHRVVRKDTGEIRIVHEKCEHFRDTDGRIIRSVGMVHDISERKQAEAIVRRSEERFKLLSETAGRLLTAENPQAIVNSLCSKIMKHLDCQAFFHFLVDEQAGRLRLNACVGIPKKEVRRIEWLDYGTAVCGCVARDRVRIVAQDIPAHPDPRTDLVASYGIRAYACHPLLAGGKVIGTLSFGTRTRTHFRDEELSLMQTVADQVAVAMQRLLAERAIRESEQRLRLALEGGRMGRWEWDVRNDASFWDERVYELLGLDRRVPAAGKIFLAKVDPRDKDTLQALIDAALAGQDDFQAEFRVGRSAGEPAWLVSRGRVIRDRQGQAVCMMGVMYEVTQRKQMEDQLRRWNDELEEEVQVQTEELRDTIDRLEKEVVRRVSAEGELRKHSQMLEAFFQHTITPLAFLDRDFRFVRVNEAYAKADKKNPEFFVGKDHFALYPHAENRAIFEQVLRTRQPYFAYARPFTYLDDPRRITYWDWQLTPLLDEHDQVQFLVLNLEDVTERQQAFQELEQRARQLQKLTLELSQAQDRERKRLAELLHDDLQQQLAAAKFHLSLLGSRIREGTATREMVAQLDQILKDAIEKSRSLSHELSPVMLYQSNLGEAFEWLARQLQTKHGLTVQVECRGRIDSPSEALKIFLYKTAQEILFNIVKHARVKEARLRLQRLRGGVWLTISDRGQGFDPKALGKTGGFGLLSIRERIELLGGRLKIRSAPGHGSTFLIAVPDGTEEAQKVKTAESRTVLPSDAPAFSPSVLPCDRRLRVLLVDDHKVVREGLAILLKEQPDMDVVGQASNGREAVDLAGELRPDVIVMDVAMPVMPGDEAAQQIKRQRPGVRIVALSMFEQPNMAETMREAGADVYLLKTAPSHELLAAIRGRRGGAG